MYETTRNSNPPSKRSTRVGFTPSLPSLRPVLLFSVLCLCMYMCLSCGKHRARNSRGLWLQSARDCVPKTRFFFFFRNIEYTSKSLTLKSERTKTRVNFVHVNLHYRNLENLIFQANCYYLVKILPSLNNF